MTRCWLVLVTLLPGLAWAGDEMPVFASTLADEPPAWRPDAMFAQMGSGSSTHAWSAGWQWNWRRRWPIARSLSLSGYWEVSVGRWYEETRWRHSDQAWTTQFSAIPSIRLADASHPAWYGDFGVGPSLLLPLYISRERTFSTEFNFQSHLAFGRLVGARGRHDFCVRVDHYSNAGLDQPNPGLTLLAMRYTLHF